MFTILLIALICYMCFVVYKTRKNMLIEEKKKEKGPEPVERPVYWCPRENRPIGREQERVTVPTKEITLEKDVANIYDLVATSVQKNLCEEASNKLEQEIEAVEEAVYDIPFLSDEDIPFPSDMDTPEEFLGYEDTFPELEQLPVSAETELILPVQQEVSEVQDVNVVKWTAKVIEREQGLIRVMNMSNRKRYWIHTEGEILPENKLMYIELEVDSPYSYTLVGWSDRQLGSI